MASTSTPPTKITKVCVFGAGQFGFALAALLGYKYPDLKVVLYDTVKEYVDAINKDRRHPVFHKGVSLTPNVVATHDRLAAMAESELLLLAVPGQYLRGLVRDIAPQIKRPVILLNVAKALEAKTNKFLSEVVAEEMVTAKVPYWFAALSGGMLAEEVTKHWPIAADIACTTESVAALLQELFSTSYLKCNRTTDLRGVELAGALKNVVAIGAGFFDGLGYEMSSKAAYVSEAAKEIRDLAVRLGARNETFEMGTHAWLGDVLTTSFGKSRNRKFGELCGKGMSAEQAAHELEKDRKHAEGYLTTKSFYELSKKHGMNLPILAAINAVLHENQKVLDVLPRMFQRSKL